MGDSRQSKLDVRNSMRPSLGRGVSVSWRQMSERGAVSAQPRWRRFALSKPGLLPQQICWPQLGPAPSVPRLSAEVNAGYDGLTYRPQNSIRSRFNPAISVAACLRFADI